MNETKSIDIEPGDSSLSAYDSKKIMNLLRHTQIVQREEDGLIQFWRINIILQNQFPHFFVRANNGKRGEHVLENSRTTTFLCEARAQHQRSTFDSEN